MTNPKDTILNTLRKYTLTPENVEQFACEVKEKNEKFKLFQREQRLKSNQQKGVMYDL